MKWIIFLFTIFFLTHSPLTSAAQVTAEYLLVESDGSLGCGRATDCTQDRFCLDLFIKFDSIVKIVGYNIFFQYDNTVMQRGASNPSLDGSDNACFLFDASDTDFDTSAVLSSYRVGAVYDINGRTIPAKDSFFLIHNFCWEIINPVAFYNGNQEVVVGEDVFGVSNIIGAGVGVPGVDYVDVSIHNVPDTFRIDAQTTSCFNSPLCSLDSSGSCPNGLTTSGVLYVDANATGRNDGSGWADALTNLQDALDCPCADSIKVATGTYRSSSAPDGFSIDPRDRSFHVNRDVVVIGGYDALTGERSNSHSVLSGDLGHPQDLLDNAHHVFVAMNSTLNMSGFIIEGGHADGSGGCDYEGATIPRSKGAGIFIKNADVILSNVIIRENHANDRGGAIWATNVSTLLIEDAVVEENTSMNSGAAVFVAPSATVLDLLFTRVELIANESDGHASAWFDTADLGQATVSLEDCWISDVR